MMPTPEVDVQMMAEMPDVVEEMSPGEKANQEEATTNHKASQIDLTKQC